MLPLINKKWKKLSSTGLIIGSIAPDFEGFILPSRQKILSHIWPGMVFFDLPMGLFIAIVFHVVVKQPLLDNMPKPWQERFWWSREQNWLAYLRKNIIIVIVSLFIGIFSHLLWDGCTHLNMVYPDSVSSILRWHGIRIFIIIQYVCSIIGLYIVWRYISSLPRTAIVAPPAQKFQFWLFVFLTGVLTGAISFQSNTKMVGYIDPMFMINMMIGSFFAGLIIVSTISKYFLKQE